jgi:hypothetical protein
MESKPWFGKDKAGVKAGFALTQSSSEIKHAKINPYF